MSLLVSFFFAVGVAGWIYSITSRRSGTSNAKPALIAAVVAGIVAFIVFFSILKIFLKS